MAGTTWDPSNKGADISLYFNNLIAFSTTAQGTWKTVRGTSGKTIGATGKFYLEIISGPQTNNGIIWGFCNASQSLINYIGSTAADGFGFQSLTGDCYGVSGSWQASSKRGEIIQLAIDVDANLVWARTDRSTNWNNSGTANPATGTGGKSFSTMTGTAYPAISLNGSSTTDTNWGTINAGGFPFAGTIPSGFSAWDTGVVTTGGLAGTTNPSVWGTKNSNIVLSGAQPHGHAKQRHRRLGDGSILLNLRGRSSLSRNHRQRLRRQ